MTRFIFDLDGTITSEETLPLIAKKFGINEEISLLTQQTIDGNIPFIESFIRRVHILGKFNVHEINDLLENTKLYPKIVQFIAEHKSATSIATGNISHWINKLVKRIGCEVHCSEAELDGNIVKKLTHIVKKEDIVKLYHDMGGDKVVFIGDGHNDAEAMRIADISIACGLTHYPARSVLTVADYLVFEEDTLYRLLNQLS